MRILTKSFMAALLIATSLASVPALAQDSGSVSTLMRRDSILPPILMWLQQQGSKLTLIGEEGGLKGYLVESPTGKMQSVYVTPDGKHIVAGILFEQGGRNVTGVQIGEMRKRFDDAAKTLGASAENASVIDGAPKASEAAPGSSAAEDAAATPAGEAVSGAPVTSSPDVAAPVPAAEAAPVKEEAEVKAEAELPAVPAPQVDAAITLPAPAGAITGADGNPSDVWASKIDRDEFLKKAEAAPYFEVGSRLAPNTVWMVADPKCPYCHAAWNHIQNLVFEKKIKVRVVLINALNGSEPFAREILASPDPARRWIVSNGGVNIEPTVDPNSKEYQDSSKYLAMNMEFARSFNIDRTPFLGYVGPDGRFYSTLGLPADMDAFLAATGAISKK